ncbi:hypothetical protein EB061_00065 [bacterium]|jgi:hypothetical protein|nr:hypothetical protein [bacterium]
MKSAGMGVLAVFFTAMFAGCGGAPVREVKVEEPQFKVTDAAPGGREAWLDHPNGYAKKEGLDTEKFYYFTGDAQSADKRMACEKANADVLDDVAKQVSTFVDTAIARASSDSTASETSGISSVSASQTETSRVSSQLSRALVSGVEKSKQYWEQRDFSQSGGAKSIFYCWVLGKVSKKQVDDLIARAQTIRWKSEPGLKAKVESKLADLPREFEKSVEAR